MNFLVGFLAALLASLGTAGSSGGCDLEINLPKNAFAQSTDVNVKVTSHSHVRVFIEDGLRVQRKMDGRWVGPELLPKELRLIFEFDLENPRSLPKRWSDVAVAVEGSTDRIEPGTYQFYVRYYLTQPDLMKPTVSCVAKSKEFTLERDTELLRLGGD